MSTDREQDAGSTGPRKLWGGRFAGATAADVERLNNSLAFDGRLWPHDIAGSIAHATMLGSSGIVTKEEADRLVAGLNEVRRGLVDGSMALDPAAEDVHTAVELLLRDRVGPLAGKLHTARSRNDQVATDTRLYVRDAIDILRGELRGLQATLLRMAEEEIDTVMPGYTHLQHAQPVLLSHHLLAYFWMFARDCCRLADARARTNLLPLGAAALAGTGFPIDRRMVADLLGFDGIVENSLDAVSDRDFIIELLACAAIVMMHCSRLAEEIILWNTFEFGFVELDDSVTTGSSIMPQKKNPDVAELARGKAGRVYGDLVALLTTMKGLPLAYNKDMQEDKEPLFDAVDTLSVVLPALNRTVATAHFRRTRMAEALHGDFSTATDLADLLVRTGMAFREAHEVVGRLVRECVARSVGLEDLSVPDLRSACPMLADADMECLTVQWSIASRRCEGGTAREAVALQLDRAKATLAEAGG